MHGITQTYSQCKHYLNAKKKRKKRNTNKTKYRKLQLQSEVLTFNDVWIVVHCETDSSGIWITVLKMLSYYSYSVTKKRVRHWVEVVRSLMAVCRRSS